MHNFRSGVDTNLVDAGMTLDQAVAVTGHTKKIAEDAYLRLQLKTKREIMDTLADAYGVGVLEPEQSGPRKHPAARKTKFEVELADDEIEAIESLAARSELESRKNSGTKPGASPRRK